MEVVSIVECIDCECASVIYGLGIFSNMTQRKKKKRRNCQFLSMGIQTARTLRSKESNIFSIAHGHKLVMPSYRFINIH